MTLALSGPGALERGVARLRLDALNRRTAMSVPEANARRLRLIPLEQTAEALTVAVAQPLAVADLRELERQAGAPVRQVLSPLNEIRAALDLVWEDAPPEQPEAQVGRWLVLTGAITEDDLQAALTRQRERHMPLGRALIERAQITEDQLLKALSLRVGLPTVPIDRYPLAPGVAAVVNRSYAGEYLVLPVSSDGQVLIVAISEGTPHEVVDDLEHLTGYVVRPVLARGDLLEHAITRAYERSTDRPERTPLPVALLNLRLVTEADLDFAREVHQRSGEDPMIVLLRQARFSEDGLRAARAAQYGLGVLDTPPMVTPRLAVWLPRQIAERHGAVVFDQTDTALSLAVSNPLDRNLEAWLAYTSRRTVRAYLADPALIEGLRQQIYSGRIEPSVEMEPLTGMLLRDGFVTEPQAQQILARQAVEGLRLSRAIVQSGALSDDDLLTVQALWIGMPHLKLDRFRFDLDLLKNLDRSQLAEHRVMPLHRIDDAVVTAVADLFDSAGIDYIERQTGLRVQPVLAAEPDICAAIDRCLVDPSLPDADRWMPLSDLLIGNGLVSAVQWRLVLQQILAGQPLDLALQAVTGRQADIAAALAFAFGLNRMHLAPRQQTDRIVDALGLETFRRRWADPVDPAAARRLSLEVARACCMLPVAAESGRVVVACADPSDSAARARVADALGEPVRWVVADRPALDAAIQRTIGRKNLGAFLLDAGLLTSAELNQALEFQARTNTRLNAALVALGIIRAEALAEFLAAEHGLLFVDLSSLPPPADLVRLLPEDVEREHGIVPVDRDDTTLTIATADPLDEAAVEQVRRLTGLQVRLVLATDGAISGVLQDVYPGRQSQTGALDLVFRRPDDSAVRAPSRGQAIGLGLALAGLAAALIWQPVPALIAAGVLLTACYLGFAGYRFSLAFKALGHAPDVPVSKVDVAALDDADLPIYTILIPLYHEADAVARLIASIDRLQYPTAKLDVKLLVEEDDPATLSALLAANLPAHIQIVAVPAGTPRGKPKACNYGLLQARGEYVVVYGAGDSPDSDQLKKALVAFSKCPPNVACIQSKLNVANRGQNVLTAWTASEHETWYDLFAPGLAAANAPIPVGGTSAHFRTEQLKSIGAWDPWNAADGADIGVRLYKQGLRTASIDSTTGEEAAGDPRTWTRQRSRWVQGSIQTWLVHMRNPFELWRELGTRQFLTFQYVTLGAVFDLLINPLYWLLVLLWALAKAGLLPEIVPAPLVYLCALALYLGSFAYAYASVVGRVCRGEHHLLAFAAPSPLHGALMSVAAWQAVLQVCCKPFAWATTIGRRVNAAD